MKDISSSPPSAWTRVNVKVRWSYSEPHPTEVYISIRMAFPQPFWAACPSAQPILLKIFFPCIWNFPSCCSCLFSVVLLWRRVYLCVLCYCLSGSGTQQLNLPLLFPFSNLNKHSLTSLSSCILCSAPWYLRGLSWSFSSLAGWVSYTGGPKLVTGLQMQMWLLRRGEGTFHRGLVTCLLCTAQYVVSLHYRESALLTCVQLAVRQGLHLLILWQCQQLRNWMLAGFVYLQLGARCR